MDNTFPKAIDQYSSVVYPVPTLILRSTALSHKNEETKKNNLKTGVELVDNIKF